MATLTRINFAYVMMGGISARYLINSAFFDLELKFTESIAALTSLTSLFSGLLIILSFHQIINEWILRFIGYFLKDDLYGIKIKIASKSDFTETIDNTYGNTLITIIIFLSSLAYFIPNQYSDIFLIPLVDLRHNFILGVFLLIISIGMGINTYLSWKNWKNRLNYFTYYEYKLSTTEITPSEALLKYRNNISSNSWDKVEEEYNQIKKEMKTKFEYISKIMPHFCMNFKGQQKEVDRYVDSREPHTWGNNIGAPLESFWKKWSQPPIEITHIFDNFYSLKNQGIALFLPPKLRKRKNKGNENKISLNHIRFFDRKCNFK